MAKCKPLVMLRLFSFVFSYLTALPNFENQPFVFLHLTASFFDFGF
jgi:hypothetical protein